jgi:hypothetical protein
MKIATLEIHQITDHPCRAYPLEHRNEQIHRDNSDKTSEQRKPQKINAPRPSNERDKETTRVGDSPGYLENEPMRDALQIQFRIQIIRVPVQCRGDCKEKKKRNMNRKESVAANGFGLICGLC